MAARYLVPILVIVFVNTNISDIFSLASSVDIVAGVMIVYCSPVWLDAHRASGGSNDEGAFGCTTRCGYNADPLRDLSSRTGELPPLLSPERGPQRQPWEVPMQTLNLNRASDGEWRPGTASGDPATPWWRRVAPYLAGFGINFGLVGGLTLFSLVVYIGPPTIVVRLPRPDPIRFAPSASAAGARMPAPARARPEPKADERLSPTSLFAPPPPVEPPAIAVVKPLEIVAPDVAPPALPAPREHAGLSNAQPPVMIASADYRPPGLPAPRGRGPSNRLANAAPGLPGARPQSGGPVVGRFGPPASSLTTPHGAGGGDRIAGGGGTGGSGAGYCPPNCGTGGGSGGILPGPKKTPGPGASPASPKPYSQDIKLILVPAPVYPQTARDHGIEGVIHVRALFRTDRTVTILAVLDSLGWGLDEAAADAVARILFEPATENGQPIDSQKVFIAEFNLARQTLTGN